MTKPAVQPTVKRAELALVEAPNISRVSTAKIQILLDDESDPQKQVSLIQSALEVHQQAENLKNCAVKLCVSLYNCKQEYLATQGSSAGWPAFAARNFAAYGMNEEAIRACVRTGERMISFTDGDPEMLQAYSRLSREALIALGGASQEVAEEVRFAIVSDATHTPSARQIKELDTKIESMKAALLKAEQDVKDSQSFATNLNQTLVATENEVIALRDENEVLARKARTPVESVILPKGVRTEAELLEKVQKELAESNRTLEQTSKRSKEANAELTEIQRKLGLAKQHEHTLVDLQNDLTAILNKYPVALAAKMNAASPEIKARLTKIAADMRIFADQISV